MLLAHGDTPLHDDPSFWHMIATVGGVGGFLSFAWYWFTH